MKKQSPKRNPESDGITTKEAATKIGCSPQQVRTLIRNGKIKAKRIPDARNPAGYNLVVDLKSVQLYAKTVPRTGWPRGVPRNFGE